MSAEGLCDRKTTEEWRLGRAQTDKKYHSLIIKMKPKWKYSH